MVVLVSQQQEIHLLSHLVVQIGLLALVLNRIRSHPGGIRRVAAGAGRVCPGRVDPHAGTRCGKIGKAAGGQDGEHKDGPIGINGASQRVGGGPGLANDLHRSAGAIPMRGDVGIVGHAANVSLGQSVRRSLQSRRIETAIGHAVPVTLAVLIGHKAVRQGGVAHVANGRNGRRGAGQHKPRTIEQVHSVFDAALDRSSEENVDLARAAVRGVDNLTAMQRHQQIIDTIYLKLLHHAPTDGNVIGLMGLSSVANLHLANLSRLFHDEPRHGGIVNGIVIILIIRMQRRIVGRVKELDQREQGSRGGGLGIGGKSVIEREDDLDARRFTGRGVGRSGDFARGQESGRGMSHQAQ